MNKVMVKLIHFFVPSYFANKTYEELSRWEIADIYNGKIYFNEKQNQEQ
jgi:hypothetical protein